MVFHFFGETSFKNKMLDQSAEWGWIAQAHSQWKLHRFSKHWNVLQYCTAHCAFCSVRRHLNPESHGAGLFGGPRMSPLSYSPMEKIWLWIPDPWLMNPLILVATRYLNSHESTHLRKLQYRNLYCLRNFMGGTGAKNQTNAALLPRTTTKQLLVEKAFLVLQSIGNKTRRSNRVHVLVLMFMLCRASCKQYPQNTA